MQRKTLVVFGLIFVTIFLLTVSVGAAMPVPAPAALAWLWAAAPYCSWSRIFGNLPLRSQAEKKKVNVCLEVLNTRVDKTMIGVPGYLCDTVEWAVEVCRQIGSARMKVLFDIFHVQIMQGDLITRIRQYREFIGHYHTAGVPGRGELDETQEIQYPAVMKAIVERPDYSFLPTELVDEGGRLKLEEGSFSLGTGVFASSRGTSLELWISTCCSMAMRFCAMKASNAASRVLRRAAWMATTRAPRWF